MIAVDNGAFDKDTEEGGINCRIRLLPGGGDKHKLHADNKGHHHCGSVTDSREPTTGEE
jgi:hypothetical protein